MTLIASFCVGRIPTLLGDVVTSTPLQGERRFQSPSLGEILINPKIDNANAPSGFSRKLVQLSDNFCIAWSGGRLAARGVVRDLRDHFGSVEVDFRDVLEFLESLKYREAKEVSLVGICKGADGVAIFGYRPSHDGNHPIAGPFYCAGSGGKAFAAALDGHQLTRSEFQASAPFLAAGGLAGSLLTIEAFTGRTLMGGYGGGFEVVGFEGGKFYQLPEATYVFWRITGDDEASATFSMHPTVLKVCYRGDDLVIRRSHGVMAENAADQVTASTSLFVVPPLLASSATASVDLDDLPDLNSSHTFHGFFYRAHQGHI